MTHGEHEMIVEALESKARSLRRLAEEPHNIAASTRREWIESATRFQELADVYRAEWL